MEEPELSVGPAAFPGVGPQSYMVAAVYGELAEHPWRDAAADFLDAYSLFVARSFAMEWLTEPADDASPGGLWATNDAGLEPDSGSRPTCAAWFQVSRTEPIPAGRPLPVQPFLSCVSDVVARIGALDLQAVQVLLPVEKLALSSAPASSREDARMPLLEAASWFADCHPQWRTPVRVTLDGGQDPSIRSVAPKMFQQMQQIKQDVFVPNSFSPTDDDMVLQPAVADVLWGGPPYHRAAFRGTLAEWSLDSLGWLAAFLADMSARHGVNTPLMLTVNPSEGPQSDVD